MQERVDAMVEDPPEPHRAPTAVSFKSVFASGEADEEQTTGLAVALDALRTRWPSGFKASDVATYAGAAEESSIEFKGALEQATGKLLPIVTPTAVTWRLKALADAPVMLGDQVVALRYTPDPTKSGGAFAVRVVKQ